MIVPFKTSDVVTYNGDTFVVNSVKLTDDGTFLELMPLKLQPVIALAGEVELFDASEKTRRVKAVTELPKSASIKMSDNISVGSNLSKQEVLDQVAIALNALFEGFKNAS